MKNILLINKPSGITSYDVIRILKKKLHPKKIGHAGTIDPLASGLLIVLIDEATKQSEKFMALEKRYRVEMQLGIKTDTGDIDGKLTQMCNIPELNEVKIKKVLKKFEGRIKQIPPVYSAIKYKGKKLYEYARAGIKVKIKPRFVEIKKIKLVSFNRETIELRVDCSKGTYIRTLVEDIAKKLKTVATVSRLVRERIGKYSVNQAVNIDLL
ncbi:MAG: tRNA pseudouridine(55) synthase TruB [Elusimicrobia bacterium CG06_land_8_20_14_3_00_38_11]|nr:MAG: tRNA pseudouridine(55) synthase TruB [Elusimicrobia bacterium CG06_land_8_20_14_3_00_38_11]